MVKQSVSLELPYRGFYDRQFPLFFGSPAYLHYPSACLEFKQLQVFDVAVVWYFEKRILCALSIVFNVMKTRDIEEMEERYLKPLIAVMEPVARLSVESQVSKLYMKFGIISIIGC